ncbi:hypothetical protein M2419_004302 [Sphingobacterium sp. BIGb0116]|nr:hypothetical protein [Sphingobacterium sp. BIGb0116]
MLNVVDNSYFYFLQGLSYEISMIRTHRHR